MRICKMHKNETEAIKELIEKLKKVSCVYTFDKAYVGEAIGYLTVYLDRLSNDNQTP